MPLVIYVAARCNRCGVQTQLYQHDNQIHAALAAAGWTVSGAITFCPTCTPLVKELLPKPKPGTLEYQVHLIEVKNAKNQERQSEA